MLRADFRQQLQLFTGGLGAVYVQQDFTQAFVHTDRRIGSGIGTTGNRAVDLAQGNFIRRHNDGLQTGTTGLLNINTRSTWVEGGTEQGFTREVKVTAVLDYRTGNEFANLLALQVVTVNQTIQRCGQHVLVRGIGIRGVGTRKRNTVTANDGYAADGLFSTALGHAGNPVLGLIIG